MNIKRHYKKIYPLIEELVEDRCGRYQENMIYNYKDNQKQLIPAAKAIENASDENRSLHITTAAYQSVIFDYVDKEARQPGTYENIYEYMVFADIDILDEDDGTELNIDDPIVHRGLQEAIYHIIDGLSKYIDPEAIYSLYSGGGAYVIIDPVIFKDFFMNASAKDKHILIETFNLLLSDIWDKASDNITDVVKLDIINSNFRWMKVPFGVHKKYDIVVTPLKRNRLEDFEVYKLENWHKNFELSDFKWFLNTPSDIDVKGLKEFIDAARDKVTNKIEMDGTLVSLPGYINQKDSVLLLNIMGNNGLFPELIKYLLDNKIGSEARVNGILSSYFSSLGFNKNAIKNLIKQRLGTANSYIIDNYSKMMCPSYKTIYESNEGFPKLGLKEFKDQLPERPKNVSNMIDETVQIISNYLKDGVSYIDSPGHYIKWEHFNKKLIIAFDGVPITFAMNGLPFIAIDNKLKAHIESFIETATTDIDQSRIAKHLNQEYKNQRYLEGLKLKIQDVIQEKQDKLNDFKAIQIIKNNPDSLEFLTSISQDYIAGEILGIRLSLIAKGISTILKKVIYIMYIADSSVGKDKLNDSTNCVIPEDLLVTATTLTVPALMRMCKEDPSFFKGKIIDMGDMGSKSEQERIEALIRAANRSTDGGRTQKHIVAEKNSLGNFDAKTYEIEQFPSVNTSSVHYYQDAQITSRTVPIGLEGDIESFHEYKKKIHRYEIELDETLPEQGQIIWKHLINKAKEYDGYYNPYSDIIATKLEGSNTERRLSAIIDHCLAMYALFRYTNRDEIVINNKKLLVIGRQDIIELFKDLKPVEETMMYGISHNFKKYVESPEVVKEKIQAELIKQLIKTGEHKGWSEVQSELYNLVETGYPGEYFTKNQIINKIFDTSNKMYDEVASWVEGGLVEYVGSMPAKANGRSSNLYRIKEIKEVIFDESDYLECEKILEEYGIKSIPSSSNEDWNEVK